MTPLAYELEIIRLLAVPEYDAIKPVMVRKGPENGKSQAIRIHRRDLLEVVSRSGQAQNMSLRHIEEALRV